MDFKPDSYLKKFRDEVRQFLTEKLDPALASNFQDFRSSRESLVAWQKILHSNGWGGPYWPKQHGGTGWTAHQQQIFDEECNKAGAPSLDIFGHKLLGPAVNEFGNARQKEEHSAKILSGDRLWCQGFSEPGSGSDLASLRTAAELKGDHYVVNGQKIWTSYAHEADWIFLLVRTDAQTKKQAGISFLLLDMQSPGISVRPIISIDNRHHLNEVFFDNVQVSAQDRVGNEGDGWNITKFLLNNEHATTAELPSLQGYFRHLKSIGAKLRHDGRPLSKHPNFRLRMVRFEAEINAIAMMVARVASLDQAGDHSPAAQSLGSLLKIRGTELMQAMSQFIVESLGDYGAISYSSPAGRPAEGTLPLADEFGEFAASAFFRRAATIYGGSSEVQRSIVSKMSFQF